MTVSSTRAARSGTRRPCSHSCTARTSRPKRSANFCRLSFNRLRRAPTRPAAGSAGQRRPRHAHGRRPLPTPSRYPVRFRCVPSSFPLPLPFDFRHQPRQRLPPRPEPAQRNWSSQCGTDYASVSLAMLATGSSSAKSSRSTRPRPSGGRSTASPGHDAGALAGRGAPDSRHDRHRDAGGPARPSAPCCSTASRDLLPHVPGAGVTAYLSHGGTLAESHEGDAGPGEGVEDGHDLTQRPAEPREFADDQAVAALEDVIVSDRRRAA